MSYFSDVLGDAVEVVFYPLKNNSLFVRENVNNQIMSQF